METQKLKKNKPLTFELMLFSSVTVPFNEVHCLKLDKCVLKFCLIFYDLLLNVFPFSAVFCFGKRKMLHGFKTGFGMTVILFLARNLHTQWGDQLHCYEGEPCSLSSLFGSYL